MKFVVEPGEFMVMVGSSSEDVTTKSLEVVERLTDLLRTMIVCPGAEHLLPGGNYDHE